LGSITTLRPLHIAIPEKSTSRKAIHGAENPKRTGTFCPSGNARYTDPEVGVPIEMSTYVLSGRRKSGGSEEDLVSDIEMLGIATETIIKISSSYEPEYHCFISYS